MKISHLISKFIGKIKRAFSFFKIYCRIKRYNINNFLRKSNFAFQILNSTSPKGVLNHNSDKERKIEILKTDFDLKQVIVTCYFTLKSDPQTGESRNKSDFKYIQPWYDSIFNLGLHGIILHDGLEESFIQKYQTEKIQFRYCEMGNYSIFEERWFLYHLLISKLEKLNFAFLTDSNDVYIHSNPFFQFNQEQVIYVGRDNANRIKDSGWLLNELENFVQEANFKVPKTYFFQCAYNAGVVGGSKNVLFFLTSKMVELILKSSSSKHKDMTILNLIIHLHFSPKLNARNLARKLVNSQDDRDSCSRNLVTGYPFNSGFKDFDFDSKAVFIHK
jgi:hypothetical protein